ncbi:hypothetical protein [Rhodococcus rhodochrous]|uniref:hypothetical protein n=1 Tax=Rhodococcus rhodochrous TaxID=1829 RepID=UPI0027E02472|nr:hypothetical protein [Rhodococcus rhodochrous]
MMDGKGYCMRLPLPSVASLPLLAFTPMPEGCNQLALTGGPEAFSSVGVYTTDDKICQVDIALV